jgi:hypothetical protein
MATGRVFSEKCTSRFSDYNDEMVEGSMNPSDDTIFLFDRDDNLQRVPRRHYENEDYLQVLIEKYPDLLAGESIGGDEGVRFLLVKREAAIPDGEAAPGRWAVDHLLLDQQGIPTLVEVKRSTDTRIRREVVGQLLEYAANVALYWPADKIRSFAVEQHGGADALAEAILDLLDAEPEEDGASVVEEFWAGVEENVRNGKLRLLFVADELPREVRRIIEFLNEKMIDVEVLGVELRQYAGGDLRAMVPRVIGQTEATRRAKSGKPLPSRKTNQAEFLAACPPEMQSFFLNVLEEAERRGLQIDWGTKSMILRAVDATGRSHGLFYFYPQGAQDSKTAWAEAFLETSLRETDLGYRFGRELSAIRGFSKSGQYTYRLHLTEETLDLAASALQLVWDVATELADLRPDLLRGELDGGVDAR